MGDLNTEDERLADLPLGAIRPTDHLFVDTNDNTCSRCREAIGDGEVPLLLWPESGGGKNMYAFCTRCAFDPDSDRCKQCGCSQNNACEMSCEWTKPGLCSNCDGP